MGEPITRLALALAVTAALIAPASGRDLGRPPTKPDSQRPQQRTSDVKYFRSPDGSDERGRDDKHGRCLTPVSGLGTQWIGLKGALDAARKDWMERVRYDHGESFVDMSHAANVGSRCGRVSIGSFLGKVMYRCEIIARPCQARFEQSGVKKFAALETSPSAIAPQPTAAPPAPTPPPAAKPPLVVRLFKEAPRLSSLLHRRHRVAAPELPPDTRPPKLHLAALFMGHIIVDALSTMELAPGSARAFVHRLLNAAFEFPVLYRALALGTAPANPARAQ
jgi:hypothetical protein